MHETAPETGSPTQDPSARPRTIPSRWPRVAVVAAGVIIVATVGLLATVKTASDPGNTTKEAFDLPQLGGGGRVRLADFKGQPTVVNFFASWCSACDFELPGFAKLSNELKGRVRFVGVDALETGDPMYMPRRHGLTWWPLAHDVGGSNGSGLHDSLGGGNSMPITAFYNANGKLVHLGLGALPESSLRAKLHELYGV